MTTKQEIENKNKAIENSEEIVFTIKFCKEELQSFAENNFGRELTDVELNRISECWDDMEKVCDVRKPINGGLQETGLKGRP
ncbi:MAG: hypothetical protein NT042_09705 [Sulfuritalea sp.]|nr:hypothetical protein [Sulfuritalea sp.]